MQNISITLDLETTLTAVARCLNDLKQPWMIIGGTAMVLHGLEAGPVSDIDIVVSKSVAAGLMQHLDVPNMADTGSDRFRSDVLIQPQLGPLPVEIIGGFRIHTADGWQPVTPSNMDDITISGQPVFVANRQRLIEIFELCGRPKDLERAAHLMR